MSVDIKQLLRRLDFGVFGIDDSLDFESTSNNFWRLETEFCGANISLYVYFSKNRFVEVGADLQIRDDDELWLEDINKTNIELAGSGASAYVEEGFITIKTRFCDLEEEELDTVATILNIGIQAMPVGLKLIMDSCE